MHENTKTYQLAVKLLAKKSYSQFKLREKLFSHDCPEAETDAVIEYLINKRWLREDFYIEARVKGLMLKGYHPRYIQSKLAEEHVSIDQEYILTIFSDYDLSLDQLIRDLIEKKTRHLTDNDLDSEEKRLKTRHKLIRYLMSKGYHDTECLDIIQERF